jgi:hypothetical protein
MHSDNSAIFFSKKCSTQEIPTDINTSNLACTNQHLTAEPYLRYDILWVSFRYAP